MTLSSNVDLPEPETPLRQTRRWSGSRKESSRRLCLVAFLKWSEGWRAGTGRRVAGNGMDWRPERYWPVMLVSDVSNAGRSPWKTT